MNNLTTEVVQIIDSGFYCLMLNGGDKRNQNQGIRPRGPLDEVAFVGANLLLDNREYDIANTLELMGTSKFKVLSDAWFAAAGPNVEVLINTTSHTTPISSWQSFYAPANSELILKPTDNNGAGQRYYLAVQGGFNQQETASKSLKVQSTFLPHVLVSKDILTHRVTSKATVARMSENKNIVRSLPKPNYSLHTPIRVITGYQAGEMGRVTVSQFFSQQYTLSPLSDRMGYRLDAEPLPILEGSMYSEGLHTGAIQIPPNGKPIVMLADRQTLGGYPKIGAVARIDLYRFAQALPNQNIRFEPVDVYSARNAWRLMHQRWHSLIKVRNN